MSSEREDERGSDEGLAGALVVTGGGLTTLTFVSFFAPLPMMHGFVTNVVLGTVFVVGGLEAWWRGDESRSRAAIERLAAWYRARLDWSYAPIARTVFQVVGVGLVVLSILGFADFFDTSFNASATGGAALGLVYLYLAVALLAGVFFVGIGVSLPGRGSWFTVSPVRLSALQRVLVTSGALLIGLFPFAIAGTFVRTGWTLAWLGVELLFIGLLWTCMDVLWRRVSRSMRFLGELISHRT